MGAAEESSLGFFLRKLTPLSALFETEAGSGADGCTTGLAACADLLLSLALIARRKEKSLFEAKDPPDKRIPSEG